VSNLLKAFLKIDYWRISVLIAVLIFVMAESVAQPKPNNLKKRFFQISMAPGLSTNGTQPGNYSNLISLNLTSGYSGSTRAFELSLLSNLNTDKTIGIQLAGIANLTGANAFGGLTRKEVIAKKKSGFVSYMSGLQVSGLTNIVLEDAFGAQVTGGVNLVKGALIGTQFSLVSNIVYKYSFGVQVSGLFNVSVGSINGTQISGFSNYTKGEFSGLQIGMLNQAGSIEGKNSFEKNQPTGFQIGLINLARKMNGFQIGLINFSRKSQGTQIGLINIYRHGDEPLTRDGTAIGLLNFGNLDYITFYTTEVFGLNYEISTGNLKNRRINYDVSNKYVTNALIFSNQSWKGESWGIGYGIKKIIFMRPDETKFYGYGLDLQHITDGKSKISNELSLLSRVKIIVGKRIAPKLTGINWYASITFNGYFSKEEATISPQFLNFSSVSSRLKNQYWPGFTFGLLFH